MPSATCILLVPLEADCALPRGWLAVVLVGDLPHPVENERGMCSPFPHRRGPDELTEREREVATLLARGLSNRRIGEQLVIAEKTVKNHVQRVLDKLDARSRAEVAARAAELGLRAPSAA